MLSKRWALFIGIALVVLFVSLHFFLQSQYISNTVKKTVEARLKTSLGQEVEVGQVALRLVPTAFIITNLSLKSGPPERSSSLLAKEVRISFSPASFFTETFLIREIEIDAPQLQILAPKKGDPPLVRPPKKGKASASAPSLVVRSISVKGGALVFEGEKVLKKISFSDLDFEVRPNLEMNRFEVDIDGKGGEYEIEDMIGEVERLEGQLVIDGEKVVLKRGSIISPQASLQADGTISIGETPQIDLSIDLHHRLEAIGLARFASQDTLFLKENQLEGEIAFRGRVKGSISDIQVKGETVMPEIILNGEALGSLKSDLSFESGVFVLNAIQGKFYTGTIDGDLSMKVLPSATPAEATVNRSFRARLNYNDLPLLPLEKIVAKTTQDKEGKLSGLFASGDLDLKGKMTPETLEAEGKVSLSRDPLFSPPLPANADGLHKLIALFQEGHALWRWSGEGLRLQKGILHFPETEMAFDANWSRADGWIASSQLESKQVRKIAETFHLPLNGYAKISGEVNQVDGTPSFRGDLLLQNAALKGVPFKKLASTVKVQGKQIAFTNGILKGSPNLTQSAQGAAPSDYSFLGHFDLETLSAPRFDFNVKVITGNPQEIFQFFELKIPLYTRARGHLSVQGDPHVFSVKGPLSASKGSLYGEKFQSGRVDLDINEKEVSIKNAFLIRGDSRLEGDGGIGYDLSYWLALKGTALRIQETGFLKNQFQGLSGKVALNVSGKGHFDAPAMHFEGDVADLSYDALEEISGEIKADWKNGAVQFSGRFQDPDLSINGELILAPDYPFTFQSNFKRLTIDPFIKKHLSGAAAEVSFSASGELEGSGKLTRLSLINLAGTLNELSASFDEYRLQNDGPLAILAREGTFIFDQSRFKGDNTALLVNGSLSLMRRWDLLLSGEADLNLITFFTKEVSSAKGKTVLDLAINDQWLSPKIFGQLKLKNGKIKTATLSQNIQITSLTALFNERQLILESFDGQLGSGRFLATGKAVLSGFGMESFGLLLQLNDARVNLAKDLPATVDGELFFKKEEKKQTLKGDLRIKKLVYQKKVDLPSIIKDFQTKEKSPAASEMPLIGRTELNIHLSGENGIQIANNIAQIPLGVDLLIRGTFDAPVLIGRINASQGEIVFRKRTFRLSSGSVDFLNPNKIDPTFDLEAKTEIRNEVSKRNYKVDLLMSGTLSHITLTLSSFPTLPKDDILSLLATGKTYADLQTIRGGAGTEAGDFAFNQFLGGTFNEITGVVEKPVEDLIGARIRVDPYLNGTNTRNSTGTRLTAEKHLLKDRLLVVYSTTLDPSEEDLINMIYEINKNISLVGNRDDTGQIGGDIRFRFEFR